tara:strand:+ start:1730 stop:1918 length:189 start_codon:yes stop_codon:yes gene_type:complete
MDIGIFIVFAICIAGCSYQAYKIGWQDGVRTGAEGALETLHEQKVISFDNKGNIVPNPYFKV